MDIRLLLNPETDSDESSPVSLTSPERLSPTALAPPGASDFELLPPELIQFVVEHLGDRKPEHHRDLAHLCAASKRFADFTRPVQYRNLVIACCDPDGLLLLLRSLLENSTLGPRLRDLEITMDLRDIGPERRAGNPEADRWDGHVDAPHAANLRLLSIFTPAQAKVLSDEHNPGSTSTTAPDGPTLISAACFRIIKHASHLTNLKFNPALTLLRNAARLELPVDGKMLFTALFDRIETFFLSMNRIEGFSFLRRLEKLEFAHAASQSGVGGFSGVQYCELFDENPEGLYAKFLTLENLQALILSSNYMIPGMIENPLIYYQLVLAAFYVGLVRPP